MKGILAILMASIMMVAVGVPMAIGADPTTSATVGDVASTYLGTAIVTTVPGPGSDGIVGFELVVTDLNGAGDILNTGWTAEWGGRTAVGLTKTGETATTKTFTGNDAIPYCTASGDKDVSFKQLTTQVTTAVFNVVSYKGLSLNFNKATFSGDANSNNNPGTVYMDSTVVTPTITSQGNVETDVGVLASNLTKTGVPDIDGNNMEANIKDLGWNIVKPEHVFTGANLGCAGTASAAFQLDIPVGTPSGTYAGSLTISAV